MFINDYNPFYDDVFLYSGFTGYPIGLNTNHPLYNSCKDYLFSLAARARTYDVINPYYPDGPPAGTPMSQYPNYWNNQYETAWFISPTLIQTCIHFNSYAGYPSDSLGYNTSLCVGVKKTGLISDTYYPFLGSTSGAGISYYGPFHIYNYVLPADLYDTIGLPYYYFTGSPEVPGYGTGATFYQIAPSDIGIAEQISPKSRTFGKLFQDISIPNLLQTLGYTFNYYNVVEDSYSKILFPNSYTIRENIWILDSHDRLIPAYIKIGLSNIDDGTWGFYGFGPRINYGYNHDSSSIIFWYNNNKLYKLGHVNGVGTSLYDGLTMYNFVNGNMHTSTMLPSYRYFIDKNLLGVTAMYNTNGSTLGAYGPDINSMVSGLSACLSNALTTLSSIWS